MNEEEMKQKIHNVMWNYLNHGNSSEEEWNRMIDDIFTSLNKEGILVEVKNDNRK